MNKRILIFPGGMPRSLAYRERASAEGLQVIGASSLRHDPAREQYSGWIYLPYVTSPDFDQALRQAIADFEIGGIFTPNPVVWDYLRRCMEESFPGVTLVNGSPVDSEMAPYRTAMQLGLSVFSNPLQLAAVSEARPSISALEIAALFRHAESIPGMCDHEKIRALCEIFRHSPAGDVVEIGSGGKIGVRIGPPGAMLRHRQIAVRRPVVERQPSPERRQGTGGPGTGGR